MKQIVNSSQEELKPLLESMFSKVDLGFLSTDEEKIKAVKSLVKTLKFLEFFSGAKIEKHGSYLEVLSAKMATKLAMNDDDRDLVVMRHEFEIEDEKNDHKWELTSTMVASGESKNQKGYSIMSKTVGYTCGIATRMVLTGQIKRTGVIGPIYEDVYQPILDELEKMGIGMIEESSCDIGHEKLVGG